MDVHGPRHGRVGLAGRHQLEERVHDLVAADAEDGGAEIVHTFLELMAAGAPYTAMARAVHIHPTVSEYLPVVLGNMEEVA
jgi:hypothetical protein